MGSVTWQPMDFLLRHEPGQIVHDVDAGAEDWHVL
jgi:hypothetical protein